MDIIKTTYLDTDENPDLYTTNSLTVRRASQLAFVILKFLQQLCEGHCELTQNALRSQTDDNDRMRSNSVDFCALLSHSLQ